MTFVFLKNTRWASTVCSLRAQCGWHRQCTNSNIFGTHHPLAHWWLPPASACHSPAGAFSCHGSTPSQCARRARVAVSCPRSSPGPWWMNESGRVNSPASSPSGGTTLRCAPYILLELLRGVKAHLSTEVAYSCIGFSPFPVSLPHSLTGASPK